MSGYYALSSQLIASSGACSHRTLRFAWGTYLSQSRAMGDFPRWVDRDDVDSQAMLSAFMRYHYRMRQDFDDGKRPIWWESLHITLHHVADYHGSVHRPHFEGLAIKTCQQRPCRRCDNGWGGYQFRWYSRYWADHYNATRRPGAWMAPTMQPEHWSDDPSIRFWTSFQPQPPVPQTSVSSGAPQQHGHDHLHEHEAS